MEDDDAPSVALGEAFGKVGGAGGVAAMRYGKMHNDKVGGVDATSTSVVDMTDDDGNDDECAICNDGGYLVLCDGKNCGKSYHLG